MEGALAQLRGRERARYVARMFSRITSRYDRMNTVMSAGRHYAWRRMAVDVAVGGLTGTALDVAAGTGDFAIELARREPVTEVVAADFSREMLEAAARKSSRQGLSSRIDYAVADAHALPFSDHRFICATVGFGVRNFTDLPGALAEMARVVVPGGRVVVLEIVRAAGGPVGRLFPLYFKYATPWLGAVLAGDREAYTYLPESVQGFLSVDELSAAMHAAGLRNVTARNLALGTVAILSAEVPP